MKHASRVIVSLALSTATVGFVPVAAAQAPGPDKLVDALEGVFGKHAARRSGAKGVCATGFFVGTPDGRTLTSSAIFSGQEIPVVARFSVGGGNPKASD